MDGAVCFFDIFSCFIIPSQMIVFAIVQQNKRLLGLWDTHTAAPRESHPPASRWALPIACDALNARTMAVREYLTFCVSSPMRCQAHFAVRVGIAHFTEGHSAPAVRLCTEGMYLSALYCAGIIRRAFFFKVQELQCQTAGARKGGKLAP